MDQQRADISYSDAALIPDFGAGDYEGSQDDRQTGEIFELRDGTRALIRPIERGDRERLNEGFESASAESIFMRFLTPLPRLSSSMLDYLTAIDHVGHEALIAVDPQTGASFGTARYVRDEDCPETAEFAIGVGDRWMRIGLGTALLHQLVLRAREAGIIRFTGLIHADNTAIRRLLEKVAGAYAIRSVGQGAMELAVDLPTGGRSPMSEPEQRQGRSRRASIPAASKPSKPPGCGSRREIALWTKTGTPASHRSCARPSARYRTGGVGGGNVEVIRELWDAYSRGDFEQVLALSDPYVVMVSLEEGPLYGQDAIRANYERWIDAWDAPEITVEEVIGAGDQVFVIARFRARGRASGAGVDARLYEVYTLRNRKLIRVDEFRERASALDAAGLRE